MDKDFSKSKAAVSIALIALTLIVLLSFWHNNTSQRILPFESIRVRLIGENADRFELTYSGATYTDYLLPATTFTIKSLDDSTYTLGSVKWMPRYHDLSGTLGLVEKMDGNGAWQPHFNIESHLGWYAMFSPDDVKRCLVSPNSALSFVCTLPLWEQGKYRATIILREYDSEQECSGDGIYELNFEYEIPARTDADMDIRYAILTTDDRIYDGKTVLRLCLLANGKARYIQPDSIRFEHNGTGDGLSIGVMNDSIDTLLTNYIAEYDRLSQNEGAFYYAGTEFNAEDRLSVIPLQPIVLYGWEYDTDYTLSMIFAENPDGSGEQYTLTLNLRFDN